MVLWTESMSQPRTSLRVLQQASPLRSFFREMICFATAIGVGGVIGAEGFIDGVEEDATDSIGTSRATLGEGNEVVNIDIGRRRGGAGRE